MAMYEISSRIYLNTQNNCYNRVLTINIKPDGPLKNYIRQLKSQKLSSFQNNACDTCSKSCFYALINPNTNTYYCLSEISELITYLSTNNYVIDYNITKLLTENTRINTNKNIIFYITYQP